MANLPEPREAVYPHGNSAIPAKPIEEYHQIHSAVLRVARSVLRTQAVPEGEVYTHPDCHGWVHAQHNDRLKGLHPAVRHMLHLGYRPRDMVRLVLEAPYVAQTDSTRLAYTRSEEHGRADRQTITAVSKYLAQHFSHEAASDLIRDVAAVYSTPGKFWILGEPGFNHMGVPFEQTEHGPIPDDEQAAIDCGNLPTRQARYIIWAIENGPSSCMKSSSDYCNHAWANWVGSTMRTIKEQDIIKRWMADPDSLSVDELMVLPFERHPYICYDHELGWRMAVGTSPGTWGWPLQHRALVFVNSDDSKAFVRTYEMRTSNATCTSDVMQAWLKNQGARHIGGWNQVGAELAKHDYNGKPVLPYIDGDDNCVVSASLTTWDITDAATARDDGYGYQCGNTDGTGNAVEEEYDTFCEDCGDGINTECDEYYNVGRYEDRTVCAGCRSDYTWVRGADRRRNYREYYVCDSNAEDIVDADGDRMGDYVDSDAPPECYIHTNEGWCHEDDCVACTDGEHHPTNMCTELARECPDSGASYAEPGAATIEHEGEHYSEHDDISDLIEEDEEDEEDEEAAPEGVQEDTPATL